MFLTCPRRATPRATVLRARRRRRQLRRHRRPAERPASRADFFDARPGCWGQWKKALHACPSLPKSSQHPGETPIPLADKAPGRRRRRRPDCRSRPASAGPRPTRPRQAASSAVAEAATAMTMATISTRPICECTIPCDGASSGRRESESTKGGCIDALTHVPCHVADPKLRPGRGRAAPAWPRARTRARGRARSGDARPRTVRTCASKSTGGHCAAPAQPRSVRPAREASCAMLMVVGCPRARA